MKVAVLGADGFLGKCIVNYTQDINFISITRKNFDLTSFYEVTNWLKKEKVDVIINCAVAGGTKSGLNSKIIEDVQNNISIFLNFYNNSNYFFKFINIGSGAEFDISTNIENANEESILNILPKDSYGYSKNVISRLVLEKRNFYTLRLFSCFDNSEPDYRLFKKFTNSKNFVLEDRMCDFISIEDFCKILKFYILNDNLLKDVNCVYQNKLWLSEILHKFNKKFTIEKINPLNYTGSFTNLSKLNIDLKGIDVGIKNYIN